MGKRFVSRMLTGYFLIFCLRATAADLMILWQPNTEPDLAGYVIYYGTQSRLYTQRLQIGRQTECIIKGLEPGRTYFFAVTAVDTAGNESVYSDEVTGQPQATPLEEPKSSLPRQHWLAQNHPNPFQVPTDRITTIAFELFEDSPVKLEILDLLGQRLITLIDKELKTGTYAVSWNGRNGQGRPVRAGVYICRLHTDHQTTTRKLVVYR